MIVLHSLRTHFWRNCVLSILAAVGGTMSSYAHNGPPSPILQNKRIGPAIVSVWGDPDVGAGRFFVLVDSPGGGSVPGDLGVEIAVRPMNSHIPEASYGAQREKLHGRVEYRATIPFDAQGLWRVRIILASSQGAGEAAIDVQVKPREAGGWDLWLFALPFLALGILWLKAMVSKGRRVSPNINQKVDANAKSGL